MTDDDDFARVTLAPSDAVTLDGRPICGRLSMPQRSATLLAVRLRLAQGTTGNTGWLSQFPPDVRADIELARANTERRIRERAQTRPIRSLDDDHPPAA
jgi:hypothetical protein